MKRALPVVFAFVLALAMPAVAFAVGGNGGGGGNGSGGGGNGSGGGTGGGSGEPLVVSSASIEEGATINAGDSITLVFSKNVCEASVRDANKALATVTDAQGNAVAINVVLADDQVNPDKKNDMVIEFANAPAAGAYTLTAKAGITSKSGDVLAEDYVLKFNVAGQAAPSAAGGSSAASGNGSAQQGGIGAMPFIVIGVIVVAGVIAGVVLSKKKK